TAARASHLLLSERMVIMGLLRAARGFRPGFGRSAAMSWTLRTGRVGGCRRPPVGGFREIQRQETLSRRRRGGGLERHAGKGLLQRTRSPPLVSRKVAKGRVPYRGPLSVACVWCCGSDHHWQPERRASRPREGTPVHLLRIDLEVVRAGRVGRKQHHRLTETFARENVAAQWKGLLPGRRGFSTCRRPPARDELDRRRWWLRRERRHRHGPRARGGDRRSRVREDPSADHGVRSAATLRRGIAGEGRTGDSWGPPSRRWRA